MKNSLASTMCYNVLISTKQATQNPHKFLVSWSIWSYTMACSKNCVPCWRCMLTLLFLIFAGSRLNTSSLDRGNLEFKLPPQAWYHRAGLCGVQRDIPRSPPHPHSHPLLWTKFLPRHCWTRLWYGGWNDWLSLISGSFHVNQSSCKSVEFCTIPTWLLITCSSSLLQQKWEKEHFSGNS